MEPTDNATDVEIEKKNETCYANQHNQNIDPSVINDSAAQSVIDSVPQRICTRCGASIVLGKPTGQMSCISIIAAIAFVVTLLLMIWACIHDISVGIGLSKIPFFWFFFILFILGAIARAGYIESQAINDSDCPECGGENTLIDINSPMGQKILAETENGRMSSVENQSNEDKGLPRSSDKMNDSICSSVEEYGIVQGESITNVVSFCTECGAVRKQREKFCGRCGHKF